MNNYYIEKEWKKYLMFTFHKFHQLSSSLMYKISPLLVNSGNVKATSVLPLSALNVYTRSEEGIFSEPFNIAHLIEVLSQG